MRLALLAVLGLCAVSPAVLINNPFGYFTQEKATGNPPLRRFDPQAGGGVVMWYHSVSPLAPSADAPAALTEFTIRDPFQNKLNSNLPLNILGPLYNYDVSFVDNIVLPVAMEVTKVPVPNFNLNLPYGWVGASQTPQQLQTAFAPFVTNRSTTRV